jgi:hypothetical protein
MKGVQGCFGALAAPAHSPYHAGGLKTERFPKWLGKALWEKQFLLHCTCTFDRTV